MANQYINPGLIDPTNPEAVQIMRRQKMAEQLIAQGQEPLQGQMVSGHFVAPSWTQGLAKGLQTYLGKKELQASDAAQKALAEQLKKTKQDWLSQMPKAQTVQQQTEVAGPVQPGMAPPVRIDNVTQKPTTEDYLAWATKGMSIDPATAQMGMQYANLNMNREAREEAQRAQREQAMEALKLRMEDQRTSQAERLAAQQEMQRMQMEARKDMQAAQLAAAAENRKLIAASRPERQTQIIQTEQGPMQLINGKAVPILGPDGNPVAAKNAAGGGNATEGERKAATLLQRMQNSEAQLEKALQQDKSATKPGLISSGLRSVGMETAANAVTPEKRQQVEAAQLDILDAALTLGTGAAYTKEQLEGYRKSYFPQIGDKPENIKDKQDRLNNILNAARIAAGRAAGQVNAPSPPSATPTAAQSVRGGPMQKPIKTQSGASASNW